MNKLLVICLELLIVQGLFFDLNKKSNRHLSKRRGVPSYKSHHQNLKDQRQNKKKSDYVCSSSSYSESIKKYYQCPTSTNSVSSSKGLSKNSQPCYDDNKYCASWAVLSECSKNPSWMSSHCPIACGLCQLCEDFNQYCEAWARKGECSTNRKYMSIYCKKSCGTCSSGLTPPTSAPAPPPTTTTKRPVTHKPTTHRPVYKCRDKRYKCKTWAYYGYCKSSKYYHFMKKNCKFSCKYCNKSVP